MDEWQEYARRLASLPADQQAAELAKLSPEQRVALERARQASGQAPPPPAGRKPRKLWPWVLGCGCLLPFAGALVLFAFLTDRIGGGKDKPERQGSERPAAGEPARPGEDGVPEPPSPRPGAGEVASDPDIEKLIQAQGPNLYALAWPTATYKSVRIEKIEPVDGGADVTVLLSGSSTFDETELWVRASVAVRNGLFTDLHWKDNSPSLFRPGSTVSDLAHSLDNINKGRGPRDSFHASPAEIEAENRKWGAFDARTKKKILAFQAETDRLEREKHTEPVWLTIRTSPGCSVNYALRFKAADKRWVTLGWYRAYDEDDEDYLILYPADLDIWVHVRAIKGKLWTDVPEGPLSLPVIPVHSFIYREGETLEGPDLETAGFFKLYIPRRGSTEHTFGCNPG
ncbi:MAG: hypothetical protein ABUT39_11255 [Acidobacteriota bacterium]